MKMVRIALFAVASAWMLCTHAQHSLEIIALKHRTADQVLAALRPVLEPGAMLSGQNNQLIVRTSPANLQELRRVLETLDRPARRLQISVRFDDALAAASGGIDAGGRISNRGSQVGVRAHESHSAGHERIDQRVQVVEGGRAFIATGQTRTLPQRQIIRTPGGVVAQETMALQEITTGFEVIPRLAGGIVFLDIAPQRETPGPSGSVHSQRTQTSVSAALGEWVELGGSSAGAVRSDGAIGSASRSSTSDSRRVWVKVEEIRN